MYVDLLGRKANQGDLVIKSSSNRSSSQLNIGVITGNSIMCMQYPGRQNDGDFKRITRVENFYIIENPNAVEIGIKNRIIEFIQQKKK